MAFIDDQERVRRQVVEEARRRLTRRTAGEVTRVVLDARAIAHFLHHLHVEQRALLKPLRLEELAAVAQFAQTLAQVLTHLVDRTDEALARRNVVSPGIDGVTGNLAIDGARQRIEHRERLDALIEELNPQRLAFGFGRKYIDHIATHAVCALAEIKLVARVLHICQTPQQPPLIHTLAAHEVQHHRKVGRRITQAVDR